VGQVTDGRLSGPSPDPADVYEAALRYLTRVPEVDHCALFLLSASRRELTHAFSHGHTAFPPPAALPIEGGSAIAHAARTGTRHVTQDVRSGPRDRP